MELPVGNNVVPLQSDTIRLVQNGCSFHGLWSEDLNQHLKDFFKLVDSLDLDGDNRERTRLRLFPFSLRDQARIGINAFQQDPSPHGRILLLVSLLNSFHQKGPQNFATISLCSNNIKKNLSQKHGLISRTYSEKSLTTELISSSKAWATIEELARYEEEGWNDPVAPGEGSLDYENPDIEQLLGVMEYKVDALIKDAISLMGSSEGVFRITSNEMYQLPLEPLRQEEFEHIMMNFILNQEERVKQLEEYMDVIMDDFMQLSSEVTRRLKEKIIEKGSRMRKIEKITRYLENEDPKPSSNLKFSETLTKSTSFHAPNFILPKSLYVKHIRTIFPSPPLGRESTFGFKPSTNNNQNIKSRYDAENPNPQSTPQVLLSFEEYIPPMTYLDEVKETIGIPINVEPFDETPIEDLGLNTCNNDIPLSSREIPSFDEPEPQVLPNFSPLDVNLGDKRGIDPLIKPHSPNSFWMKVVDPLPIHTPPLPHVASFRPKEISCYYHPCVDDPKKHYGFKPGLLGQSGSLSVDFLNLEVIVNNFLEGLSFPVKPKEVENGRIKETHHLEHIIQHPPFQYKALSHHDGILETASQAIHDAVTTHQVTASHHFMTASARTNSNADLEDSSYDGILVVLLLVIDVHVRNINTTQAQQKALDDALVALTNQFEFGKCNMRFKTKIKPKEDTFQVVLDALALTPFYRAFLITADVPAIYMQEF
ncbi:hypothetical protein Tco_1113004 [Tanacetum coccineum]|uniref:Uncharacterized protein n=1 Tax=Tanacetum coccineum TaxID=301880 RepID=A0ABQ5IQX2_9ASTR